MKKDLENINTNKNVNWMNSPGFWTFYILLIFAFRSGLLLLTTDQVAWTTINILHAMISFMIMHWIKGSPDEAQQGEYRGLTFYEQIDGGMPWTATKKFLMLVPTALFLIASVVSDYSTLHLMINFPIWVILILAKLPELHRVRIFGINSTVGIDDGWRY